MVTQMSVVTEIVVWVSPVLVGILGWLLIDLYKDLKDDVKEVKTSNANIRTDIAKQAVQITNMDGKLTDVAGRVDSVRGIVHEIDKRTANVKDLNGTIVKLSTRLDASDKAYGKILMIIDKIAVHVGLKKTP